MNKYIAVDLGGTNIRAALVDDEGTIIEVKKTSTDGEKGWKHSINKLIELIESLNGYEDTIGIGVGCPGPLDPVKGLILKPTNLPLWDNVPLSDLLSFHFDKPCFVNNDANVAGLAEAFVGAGANHSIVQYITVSTGIGGGLVINGKLIDGATFNAGEIGNIIVDSTHDFKHNFLNKGAVEGLASGTALTRIANEKGIKALHAGDLFNDESEVSNEIIDKAADNIARLMSTISHVVDPSIYVFGGTVMSKDNGFFELVTSKFETYVYPQMHGKIQMKKAQLDEPGIIGAAMLVKSNL
jgi:glucokinase